MKPLKQSTASQTRVIGGFVDDTDFKTPETGLTIANTDIKISKNGATAVNKNSGGATALANGMYAITLDATDTDTVGELDISVKVSGALLVWVKFFVLEEAVYDAMYLAAAAGPLQSTTGGRKLDVTATGAAGIDWANIENPTTVVDLSGTDINLVDTTTVNTDMRGTNNALLAASAPTNFVDLAITATTGRVSVGTSFDKTGYTINGVITTLDGLNNFNPATDTVSNVTTVGTTTTNTDMRGTDSANTIAPDNTSIAAILADTGTTLPAQISGLNDITVGQIFAGGDIDGFTFEEAQKLLLSALAAKLSGAATTTVTIRAADDSRDRIVATVDADGNRSAVTLDAIG